MNLVLLVNLKDELKQRGMSAEQLAEGTEMFTGRTVRRACNGGYVYPNTAAAIARKLKVKVCALTDTGADHE